LNNLAYQKIYLNKNYLNLKLKIYIKKVLDYKHIKKSANN